MSYEANKQQLIKDDYNNVQKMRYTYYCISIIRPGKVNSQFIVSARM